MILRYAFLKKIPAGTHDIIIGKLAITAFL